MTTSVLTTFVPGGLYDHDIQTLHDYALEAPTEWRHALQELLEVYEHAEKRIKEADEAKAKAAETEEEIKTLRDTLKTATTKMKRHVEKLEEGRRKGNLTKGDIDAITAGINTAFTELEDEAE